MTVDELIAALKKLSDEGHGELPVVGSGGWPYISTTYASKGSPPRRMVVL